MKKILMVVPSFSAKGGITSLVNGYKGIDNNEFKFKFLETYCDKNILFKFLIFIISVLKFLYIIIIWRPNIIHFHMAFGGSFYRKSLLILISKIFRKKYIIHIHGSYIDDFYYKVSEVNKKIKYYIINGASKIIVLSKEWYTVFSKIFDSTKIVIVPNYGCVIKDINNQSRCNPDKINILFLGFISELKGCFDLAKVINIVVKENRNINFIVAGCGEIDKMKSIIDCNYIGNVSFPGWVDMDMKNDLLNKANIFILPSYSEGMPMSILEAMGFGLPIVSTNIGGIPNLVKNGENGFLSNPGDIKSISKSILVLANDEKLRKKMGNNSIIKISNNYSFDSHINKLFEIYRQLYKETC